MKKAKEMGVETRLAIYMTVERVRIEERKRKAFGCLLKTLGKG